MLDWTSESSTDVEVDCECRGRSARSAPRCRKVISSVVSSAVFTLSSNNRTSLKRPCRQPVIGMESISGNVGELDVHELFALLNRNENVLVIDSRCFMDYNKNHVRKAVNVANSKIGKRRLEHDRVSVRDLLVNNCDLDSYSRVVVYDANCKAIDQLTTDSFIVLLLSKLTPIFEKVSILIGGFSEFQRCYPDLCDDKQRPCAVLSSTLSQPCMPIANVGPTRILPFLYLGSQTDANNRQLLWEHNITYVLNVSASCPKSDAIAEPHFMRISVNDNYSEKLLPHFGKAFNFLDRVRESSACVLVHCLAGVSRSPTIAIAYVMKHLRMSSDDAYRYVKSKRPTISPNFNFLGQLLEYEKQLRLEKVLSTASDISCSAPLLPTFSMVEKCELRERDFTICFSQKKQRLSRSAPISPRQLTLSLKRPMETVKASPPDGNSPASGALSPTTGLARLSFGGSQENLSVSSESHHHRPEVARSVSCNLDWFGGHEDENLPPPTTSSIEDANDVDLKTNPHHYPTEHSKFELSASALQPSQHRELKRRVCKTPSGGSVKRLLPRSDSVSTTATSGYGSQISDQPDHLDAEEDDDAISDDESEVVLRRQRDDCLRESSIQEHSKVCRQDSAYKSMTFDETCSIGPKDRIVPLGSPLSPSEQHFVHDFDEDYVKEPQTFASSMTKSKFESTLTDSWRSTATDFESSHDSGFVSSITSSRNSLTSSMRSSVMSTSGTCGRIKELFSISGSEATSSRTVARMESARREERCSQEKQLFSFASRSPQLGRSSRIPERTNVIRAHSLPRLDSLRKDDLLFATSKAKNRHSYSGAVDLGTLETSTSTTSIRRQISVAVN